MKNGLLRCCFSVFLLAGVATAPTFAQANGPSPQQGFGQGGPPPGHGRPPFGRAFHAGPPGRWWDNADFIQLLSLTPDQQKRMDAVFQANRPHLIDLSATVQKEELAMQPLVDAEQPDETKVLAQIDRVAQARAELEKANARMLLGLRGVLTPDQWQKLRASEPQPGEGGWHRREQGPPPNN